MAELFGRDKSVISRHLRNVFRSGEIERDRVVARNATTADDGKTHQVEYFSLDAILSRSWRASARPTRLGPRRFALTTMRPTYTLSGEAQASTTPAPSRAGCKAAIGRPLLYAPVTNVYIDGLNLYYGCLRGSPNRWLDLGTFVRLLLPSSHAIHRIRYYTARVSALPHDPEAPRRQASYLRALATVPNLSITFGHFLTSKVMMPLVTPPATGSKFARVIKSEEKGSDVNLASHLLVDAFTRDCAVAFVISNDSDLLEPIRIVRRMLGMRVGLASPYTRVARVLADEVDFIRPIWPRTLERSQFAPTITDARGAFRKPADW
jgi:hypothetical protein